MSETSMTPDIHEEQSPTQRWEDNLTRVIRRYEISQLLQEPSEIQNIKDTVRDWEQHMNIPALVEGIVNLENVTPDRLQEAQTKLYEKVSAEYPGVRGVVLLGSSSVGGAALREVFGTSNQSDLDWGIIIDTTVEQQYESPGPQEPGPFEARMAVLSKEAGTEVQMGPDFAQDRHHNPSRYYAPTLENPQQAEDFLIAMSNNQLYERDTYEFNTLEIVNMYFTSSVPTDLNASNRENFLSGLSSLAKKDEAAWQRCVERFMFQWEDTHQVKRKHLQSEDTSAQTKNLVREVSNGSAEAMSVAMKELLLSTKNS